MKGKLIVIEGLDFTGKTTQIKNIINYLESYNIPCISTREPGGTLAGESIREILFSEEYNISKEASLLLFMASRAENISKIIMPALENGINVICDRFIASTIVYQGVLSGFKEEDILLAHNSFNFGIYPDLTIILDATEDEIIKRRGESLTRQNNKYDYLSKNTLTLLREGFLKVATNPKMNAYIIESEAREQDTFFSIKNLISTYFQLS